MISFCRISPGENPGALCVKGKMMNDLIKVNYETGQPTVSARELHEGLKIGTRFNDWFPRMIEYGFTEGKDFYSKMSKTFESGGSRAENIVY